MTFAELANLVGADADGLGGGEIVRVSRPQDATEDAAVFATEVAALEAALASHAGSILASAQLFGGAKPDDRRVLLVQDARYAFALAGRCLRAKIASGVHATAVIGDGVVVGAGTTVGPHVVIGDGVELGEECSIGARVTIYAGSVLGNRVVVQAGAVLGSTGFGYARDQQTGRYLLFPQQGTLVIEDDVEIGANTTIDRGALAETRIGRGTKIDNLVHVGHNCRIGEDVIIAAQTGISGSSVVEDGAILGGQVGIGEHATVGKGVILGGGAGVLSGKKMAGAGKVFWGRPARPLKDYLRGLASFSALARLRDGRSPKD
ncbi:UDP-3-O-(3-hydroxymyristoyl)glucosamine N-acyltransferase [Granulicella arctica]|uniref:UDP-3-O-(3-hydroxymyristoyl)glucosamine N-acyltransferase n=1 Tax=Granulicella arctica TaxID=940613 RepID=UPI0021DF6569|nr:UDP-3-O-(3-hydroxymyristoyl)glucosamine N-acyltransferase [Granulicella arctica]